MAQTIAYSLETDSPAHDAGGKAAWSARRKLLCAIGLSAAAWLVVLTPLAFIG